MFLVALGVGMLDVVNGRPPVSHPADGPGAILDLIVTGRARTRGALAEITGLSRSTVGQRLDQLLALKLVKEGEVDGTARGRPSRLLHLNAAAAHIVCVDIGEERTRIAVTDLNTQILAERVARLSVSAGPEVLLNTIVEIVREIRTHEGLEGTPLAGLGLGLPAPVDYDAGRLLGWSIMSGWDGFDIRGHLRNEISAPILIDNDVNLLTLAEQRRFWPDQRHMFYIKAGTGVGSGIVIDGRVHRGAQGAAGDIGHAHIPGYGDPVCRCGNLGCLESLVGGWALARDLTTDPDAPAHDARDVANRVKHGDSEAVQRLRAAGRVLGEAVAYATSLLNPDVIVLGGMLGTTGDHLLAGVREVIYQRALPLATRQLLIVGPGFKSRAGIAGASYLVRDHVLSPASIERALAGGGSPFTQGEVS